MQFRDCTRTRGEATNLKPQTASTKAAIQGLHIRSPTRAADTSHASSVATFCGFFVAPMPQGRNETEDSEMKMTFAIMALLAITATAGDLFTAIGEVESRNNDQAVGDHGKAVGRYQIHMSVIADVNRNYGTSYKAADRTDASKAREIMEKYLAHWARHYERTQGRPATDEIKARIWNGGPSGWRKASTLPYWQKVKAAMDSQNTEKDEN